MTERTWIERELEGVKYYLVVKVHLRGRWFVQRRKIVRPEKNREAFVNGLQDILNESIYNCKFIESGK